MENLDAAKVLPLLQLNRGRDGARVGVLGDAALARTSFCFALLRAWIWTGSHYVVDLHVIIIIL